MSYKKRFLRFSTQSLCLHNDIFLITVRYERTESTSFTKRFVRLDPCPLGGMREHINQVTRNSINFLETSHNFLFL